MSDGLRDDGPECETCGLTTCPDADLPGFSEPVQCIYRPVYEAMRYDRCEYGCGRDITNATVRRAVRALLAATPEEGDDEREAVADVAAACMCAPDCGERIACTKAGQFGHSQCGSCDLHNVARHICCCATPESGDLA